MNTEGYHGTLTLTEVSWLRDALRQTAAGLLEKAARFALAGDHHRAEGEARAAYDRYRLANRMAELHGN